MASRTITIRGVPEPVLRRLRQRAARQRRSLNAELLVVLEEAEYAAVGGGEGQSGVRDRGRQPYAEVSLSSLSGKLKLSADVKRKLVDVCRRRHIRALWMFGSLARGTSSPESDLDLLAEFEAGMTPGFGIVTVAEELGRVVGQPVDLVTPRGLAPRLRERILAEAIPIYRA